MSSHYQIKFKTERIVEIIYGCHRYRQFVTDIDINRAGASAIFFFPSPRPHADFQRLSSYHIPSSATGGKFAVAGLQIAGASENFVLNY
jgi:hypothetical protein